MQSLDYFIVALLFPLHLYLCDCMNDCEPLISIMECNNLLLYDRKQVCLIFANDDHG